MSRPPSDENNKFMLRMPDGMRDTVAALAKANGRSVNAQMILMLSAQLEGEAGESMAVNVDLRRRTEIMENTVAEAGKLLAVRGGAVRFYELSIRTLAQAVLASGRDFDPALMALLGEWADYRGMFPGDTEGAPNAFGSKTGE